MSVFPWRRGRRPGRVLRHANRRGRLAVESLEQRRLLAVTTAVQSGEWDEPTTWSAGVPDATDRAIIPSGRTVTLAGDDHIAKEIVVQGGVLDVEESGGAAKTLTANWIHVNSGGVFRVGSEADRYDENDFIVTLTGDDPTQTFVIEGAGTLTNNDGFLMAAGGGSLQFYGEEKLEFTRLASTADVGANQIVIESAIDRDHDGDIDADDGSVNWEVGDQIVIASSSTDYRDEEVRTITAIADRGDGTLLITLDAALAHRHYGEIERYTRDGVPGDFNSDGVVDAADYTVLRDNLGAATENKIAGSGDGVNGITTDDFQVWRDNFGATAGPDFRTWEVDMRAEVAILSRNVKFQGLAAEDTDNAFGDRARFNAGQSDGFGAHTMIMPSAGSVIIDSVQFDRMGQTARQGRYPIHWHIAGDRTGDVLRGSSITNSNNRGVTVHATHNLLVEGNVLHDIHGHGFFIEDAVETGNLFYANIALGIHQVGRDGNVIDLSDPFIVDTHDHVGQNATRFLSSAAYWITNPDNDFIGNVAAGSAGTGFWFIFPDSAIGAAANDPQYNNVRPDRVNLGRFEYNSSHSAPIGLNFDRGSDLEVPIGAPLKANFDGDAYRPSVEPLVYHYTGYKHTTGIYHRGRTGHFQEIRMADNFTGTFLTFTQRISDTLYVGHSRGNSDPGQPVTGHTFYDGANTHDGTHFAGFTAPNAHMLRTQNVAIRHTHFVMRDTSFEDDGSAFNLRYSNQNANPNASFDIVGSNMPSIIYDEDGTLTSHVGGGPGTTVVPDHPFFYDSGDTVPTAPGWNTRLSDDLYAVFRLRSPSGQNPVFRVTSPDGDQGQDNTGSGQFAGTNALVKMDAGDYAVDLPGGLSSASSGFDVLYFAVNGPRDGSTVVKFSGMGSAFSISNRPFVGSLAAVRNASQTSWTRVGDELYVNFFSVASETDRVNFVPGATADPNVLWVDNDPASGASIVNSGLSVNTVSGAVTGDASRAAVAQVAITGNIRYGRITPGEFAIPAEYRGAGYELRVDYFIPPGTTLDSPDFLYVQLNVNGVNTASRGFVGEDEAGTGWQSIVLTGTLPNNTNNVQPNVTVADGGNGAAPPNGTGVGVAFYLDNISFTVGLGSASGAGASTAIPGFVAVGEGDSEEPASFEVQPQADGFASYDDRLALLLDDRTVSQYNAVTDEAFSLIEQGEEENDEAEDEGLSLLTRSFPV
ncbi:MAG: G8 domain-containing protein [Planctomycetota bacterium]